MVADNYTNAIPSFSTSLPRILTVGIANVTGKFLWAVDWEQGLQRKFEASTKPRLSFGGEYRFIPMLPVRAGYSVGGDRNAVLSLGSGFDLGAFYLDYAFVTGSSLSGSSSKGLNLALSTGLRF
ncbi:MAG: hypothetical protein D6800_10515 [Candidatus Zixiibacteriota bacterium]|nr:MAG: hypothetical protein D6800_10515 [candidate division Zixibacteria bacterium]